jgi:membrane dipeptidase
MAGYKGEADLPKVTRALLDGGFEDREVEGILGGNALRVLERVEAEAARATSP